MKIVLRMKGWAPRLASKKRPEVIRKRPIATPWGNDTLHEHYDDNGNRPVENLYSEEVYEEEDNAIQKEDDTDGKLNNSKEGNVIEGEVTDGETSDGDEEKWTR